MPKKVAIVAWRAEMERLPTKCALVARNISVQNQMGVFCGDYEETSDHLFVACQFAQILWLNIAGWCLVLPIIAFSIKDILSSHDIYPVSSKRKKAFYVVILVTFWCIWKSRNEVVFGQAIPNTTKILDEIKAMAYLWVKNRAKVESLTWEDWSRFSFGE